MANICSNRIIITDHFDQIRYASFLYYMESIEHYESKEDVPWICNIEPDGDTIHAESRWSPCQLAMVELAKLYELSFTLEYEEGGMQLFGEYVYDGDTEELTHRCIKSEEWINNDEANDSWYDEMEDLLSKQDFEVIEL